MNKRLTKLEEGLSPRQKAALVFSLKARGERDRADRLEKSVAIGVYRIRDLVYVDRGYRLPALAFAWGFMHWEQVAEYEKLHRCLLCEAQGRCDVQVVQSLMAALGRAEGRLVALDTILQEICNAHGIDVHALRQLVDAEEPHEPTWPITPDADYNARIRECLSRLAA